ncbi:MAG: acetyl-CoA carboxylase biotin carboxyl carrier protein [Planctomycetota bacterium]
MAKRPNKQSKQTSAVKPQPARAARGGQDRLAELQRLIELMVEKDVVEVEIEETGTRWRVRRKDPQSMAFAAPTAMAMAAPGPGAVMPVQNFAATGVTATKEPQGEVFKSPMLGTFYRAASPEAEAFAKPGDRVNAETTLCIIEAMKVMNEIKAEREFEIVEVLVKNGDPVEFGQPLFLIR